MKNNPVYALEDNAKELIGKDVLVANEVEGLGYYATVKDIRNGKFVVCRDCDKFETFWKCAVLI